MGTNRMKRILQKIPMIYFFFFLIVIYFVIRNYSNISKLRNDGIETKGWIYRKSSVGSKGTIRSFYTFEVGGKTYEGFYDNPGLKQWDSISIIYYRNDPSLNQAKQFVEDYR